MSDFLKRLSRDPYTPIDGASVTRIDELGNGYDDWNNLIAPNVQQPEQTWGETALGVATAPARLAAALAGSLSPYGQDGWQVPPIINEGADALTAVGDAYTGKMAPEDINSRALGMASFMMGGGGLAARPAGGTGMFAGRLAKTADHEALARAEKMAAEGADRQAIWDQTGWFKGPDQKWRFEIDDSGAKFDASAVTAKMPNRHDIAQDIVEGMGFPRHKLFNSAELQEYAYPEADKRLAKYRAQERGQPLSTALQHDNFFSAYPDAGDIGVAVENLPGYAGTFNDNRITFGGGLRYLDDKPRDDLSTVLHEGQHAIQKREGFANGGSKEGAGGADYKRLAGEVEARNVQTRMNMSADQRRATPPWETQDIPDADQIVRLYSNSDSRPALLAGGQDQTEEGYADGGRVGDLPRPYSIARSMVGQREGRGNDLLNRFLNGDTAGMTSAEYAWCSRFIKQAAIKGGVPADQLANVNDMARSWLKAGQPVNDPRVGDVVVLSRGDPNSEYGHVGFYEGKNPDGSIRILSGNHNNMVASGSYPSARVLGYRRLDGTHEAYDPATGQYGSKPLAMIDGVGRELPPLPAPTDVASSTPAAAEKPSFDLARIASLFADDDQAPAPQVQFSPIPAFQSQGPQIASASPYSKTFANGGQVRGLPDQSEPLHAGPLHSTVPGRTDHLPITVAAGSFVLPADVVSGLGEGNTNAGMQAVSEMFPLPPVRRSDGGRVPIAAAGGEYVIAPETVAALGGGDLEAGHELLDDFVLRTRANTIQRLRALPSPEK